MYGVPSYGKTSTIKAVANQNSMDIDIVKTPHELIKKKEGGSQTVNAAKKCLKEYMVGKVTKLYVLKVLIDVRC